MSPGRLETVTMEEAGQLFSRKGGPTHGLGMVSIQRVAEQYHGYRSTTQLEKEFTLQVGLSASN